MEPNFSCLHPNPGWTSNQVPSDKTLDVSIDKNVIGKHCILELYKCDPIKLNDEAFLRTVITNAARIAGATLLNLITHRFNPYGVTGLALLAESHISIHTWPESGYAAVDVFTCGLETNPEKACEALLRELSAKSYSLRSFQRKTPESILEENRKPTLK